MSLIQVMSFDVEVKDLDLVRYYQDSISTAVGRAVAPVQRAMISLQSLEASQKRLNAAANLIYRYATGFQYHHILREPSKSNSGPMQIICPRLQHQVLCNMLCTRSPSGPQ